MMVYDVWWGLLISIASVWITFFGQTTDFLSGFVITCLQAMLLAVCGQIIAVLLTGNKINPVLRLVIGALTLTAMMSAVIVMQYEPIVLFTALKKMFLLTHLIFGTYFIFELVVYYRQKQR